MYRSRNQFANHQEKMFCHENFCAEATLKNEYDCPSEVLQSKCKNYFSVILKLGHDVFASQGIGIS